jgi:two-component SAPR family response regulator
VPRHLGAVERSWPFTVSVLGTPRVFDSQGRPVEFERSKALELVVWLALHRPRCTRSGARHALWDLPIRDSSFANIVCDARRHLAHAAMAPPGTDWIGRCIGDELPLHAHITTDADLLRHTLRSANAQGDGVSTAHLRSMLGLVRGVPFEGAQYVWADAEGITSELTMLIVQAAAMVARRCLDIADVSGVFDATAVGLRVVPRHEELVSLRLRSLHRNGDDAGVREEWAAYERALTLDPFTRRPSSKMLALREELLRRPVSA